MCVLQQDDKNASSTKESLDDLFPTEDEDQSQGKTLTLHECAKMFIKMKGCPKKSQIVNEV